MNTVSTAWEQPPPPQWRTAEQNHLHNHHTHHTQQQHQHQHQHQQHPHPHQQQRHHHQQQQQQQHYSPHPLITAADRRMSYQTASFDPAHWHAEQPQQQQQQQKSRELPPLAEAYTDASSFQPRLPHNTRATPASSPGGEYGGSTQQQFLTNTPPPPQQQQHSFAGSWKGLPPHENQHARSGHIADAPLTLQIPQQPQEIPRMAPAYGAFIPDASARSSTTQAPPPSSFEQQSQQPPQPQHQLSSRSLPSFATLQETAHRSEEAEDGPEIAPMSSRLSCYMCAKLRPMVEQAAVAVAELDCQIQTSLQRSVTRSLDYPKTSPLRTVEWILDRLRQCKGDLTGSAPRSQDSTHHHHQHQSFITPMESQNVSPPTSLKRPLDAGDSEDPQGFKRPRSGGSVEQSRSLLTPNTRDDYRTGYDFPQKARSPTGIDSAPTSAHPRAPSPSYGTRTGRPLPSPLSMAFPLSAAPSLPPIPGQNATSPATSYHPPSSIHTASSSSATSQHIADLQHQVTLKSLALQTLQSEYSTLLQKLQRERVKSQTIEKKTTVADQEVNDLTTKNEELSEQIKILESQLEQLEKKRDAEHESTSKEKEQWGRMLDMSSRLQAKTAEDLRKIREEKTQLLEHIDSLEEERASFAHIAKKDHATYLESPRRGSGGSDRSGSTKSTPKPIGTGASKDSSRELEILRRENSVLQNTVDRLHFVLKEVSQQYQSMNASFQSFVNEGSKFGQVLDNALRGRDTKPVVQGEHQCPIQERRARETGSSTSPEANKSTPLQHPSTAQVKSVSPRGMDVFPPPGLASIPSAAEMAAVARATSPGPAELGIQILPTTSSPEELIRALGPLPARGEQTSQSSGPSSASTDASSNSAYGNFSQQPGNWSYTS